MPKKVFSALYSEESAGCRLAKLARLAAGAAMLALEEGDTWRGKRERPGGCGCGWWLVIGCGATAAAVGQGRCVVVCF